MFLYKSVGWKCTTKYKHEFHFLWLLELLFFSSLLSLYYFYLLLLFIFEEDVGFNWNSSQSEAFSALQIVSSILLLFSPLKLLNIWIEIQSLEPDVDRPPEA